MNSQSLVTVSNALVLVGAILIAAGTFAGQYFRDRVTQERDLVVQKQRGIDIAEAVRKERAQAEEKKSQEIAAQQQAEVERRRRILNQLRQLYLLSHDGISPEMAAGTAPLPKAWVEQQLKQRDETWTQDEYY